jgi:hypothetical protein
LAGIPVKLNAQFEQKLSLNLSAGYFNTLGWEDYEPSWAIGQEIYEPYLIANFKSGISIIAGIQYNFSRHLSVEFFAGWQFSGRWYYDYSDEDSDPFNYLYWELYEDTIDYNVVASGEHYMDLSNLQFGLAPRYYLLPGKKVNPFIMAGITLNYVDVYFEDTEYQKREELDIWEEEKEDYEGYYHLENWFDYHVGIGIKAGVGIELVLSDRIGITAQAHYDFVPLPVSAFLDEDEELNENFHGLNFQVGARFSFLKSKDL